MHSHFTIRLLIHLIIILNYQLKRSAQSDAERLRLQEGARSCIRRVGLRIDVVTCPRQAEQVVDLQREARLADADLLDDSIGQMVAQIDGAQLEIE